LENISVIDEVVRDCFLYIFQKDENEGLKASLEEARAQRVLPPPAEKAAKVQAQKDSGQLESSSLGEVVLPTSQVAPFSLTPPQNATAILHDMSLKRISFLEQEALRCGQLEDQVRQLKKELQVLNQQYNGLLVVDGERLERIEELENDVIDLRQLLKEQVSII
ncbi:hypothetical protein COOONC_00414, partial [Cooperia oncophora]